MEVESSYPKYSGRVPALDVSEINLICFRDSDLHEMWAAKPDLINSSLHNLERSAPIHHPYYDLHQKQYKNMQKPAVKSEKFLTTSITALPNFSNSNELPLDPRDWTRTDVWKWLICMAVSEGLEVTTELPKKFPMNGKALCLMSLDMYLSRVPVGGKMLYRDFRVRLAKAMASQS